MRFYLKLLVVTALFAGASSSRSQRVVSDFAYHARVIYVMRFGSNADLDALVDDTQRMKAQEQGHLGCYEAGKRYLQLLAEDKAAAARHGRLWNPDQLEQLATEAFGPPNAEAGQGHHCSCASKMPPRSRLASEAQPPAR